MAGERFRRELKQESEQWRQEGLISQEVWQRLADRYQFDQLSASGQAFSTILYAVGGILIGLAVITSVAANWQNLDRISKFILLLTWLIVSNSLGFYLWQYTQSLQRLGQGILLAAGLSLGGVIALVAQIFHLSGPLYGLFFIWSIGVLVMGGSLRFQTLTMMGLIILAIGYGSYFFNFDRELHPIGELMPIISLLLLPLAYWLESRAVFVLIILLWLFSQGQTVWYGSKPLIFILPAVILWGYDDSLKLDRLGSYLSHKPMQPVARVFSVLLLGICLYFYSFKFVWHASSFGLFVDIDPSNSWVKLNSLEQLYFGLLCGVALYVVVRQLLVRNEIMTKVMFGALVGFTTLSFIRPTTISYYDYYANYSDYFIIHTFITNCFLAALSLTLIRLGTEKLQRAKFWFGMILLCLQIISRFFEYDTGLSLKAFVLGLCGVAILGWGIWFERYLQQRSMEANS
ncbi:MAG: DUF2157 domain-containing protein [Pseudanabaenaceae cyanobacterium SKYGB_i_bin29]|nr:DUF2157 domain-containing protein [Pseudanabaenaceae cyanobacterium SKYG29]MDW8420246.1 DUF2157 domain-containing protein [Pseudanabaenaceae cyanobacterium SKYGB_i_bin29]